MKGYNVLSNKKLVDLCIDRDPLSWFEFVSRFKRLVSYAVDERLKRWGSRYQQSDIEYMQQEIFLAI